MSQQVSSILILGGIVLVVLALWYLSVLTVRWDTRRKGMRDWERQMWVIAAAALPLFGFAVYLFTHVLKGYLTPTPTPPEPENITQVKARPPAARPVEPWSANAPAGQAAPAGLTHDPSAWGSSGPLVGGPLPQTGQNGRGNGHVHQGAQIFDTQPGVQPAAHQTPSTIPAPYHALRTRYALVILQGPGLGQQFNLDNLPVRIGRGPGADLRLNDDLNVSRQHAEIYEWNGALHIRDLGSTHGTQVNSVPIVDHNLTPGDRVAVGGTVLILRELP